MINISEAVKSEFLSPAQKNLTLIFSDGERLQNDSIYTETMNLEQTLCDEEQVRFGACAAACFKIHIKGTSKRYIGLTVQPYIGVTSGSMLLGSYKIVDDELSDNREYRSLTAYDKMKDILIKNVSSWYSGLTFPMTLKAFRNSLFSHLGVSQEVIDLPNDNMVVQRTIGVSDAVLSGQKVLEAICEINGCFGCITPMGLFRYVFIKGDNALYPANDLYPSDDLYPEDSSVRGDENDILQGGLVYQEYETKPITRVQIRNNDKDVGATAGTVGNDYQITDNFLVYGKDADTLQGIAEIVLDSIKDVSFIPAKATMRGRPWVELGDNVFIEWKRDTVYFPILHRVLSGITALKDEFDAKGKEYYEYNINSYSNQIRQIRQKTLEIDATVDQLRVTMTEFIEEEYTNFKSEITMTAQQIQSTVEAHYSDLTSFKSQITQRADGIESRVTQTENGITTMQSTITQTASQIRQEITNSENGTKAYIDSQVGDLEDAIAQVELGVQNGMTRAQIIAKINNDNTSTAIINADNIDLTGLVTVTDLSTAGKTVINGSNITTGTLDANLVRAAWNNYSNVTYLDGDGLHIRNSGNQEQLFMGGGGLDMKYNGTYLGTFGGSHWVGLDNVRGLVTNMVNSNSYISWAYDEDGDGIFTTKLTYASPSFPASANNMSADALNFGCAADFGYHDVKRLNVVSARANGYNAFTGKFNAVYQITDTGYSWSEIHVENGLIVGWGGPTV